MNNYDFTPEQNMMMNIKEEGVETMMNVIESIIDPIDRFRQRNLFYRALDKMEGKK